MVAVRIAYEKRARPGGVRRGREPGVPVGIYHELDEAFRQIEGLTVVVGATRDALLVVGSGEPVGEITPPAPGNPPGTVIKQVVGVTLNAGAAYAQQARAATWTLKLPTRILAVAYLIDINGATTTKAALFATADGGSILRTGLQPQAWSGGNGTVGQQHDVTSALRSTDTVYAAKTNIIFGLNALGGQPTTKITVLLTVEQHVTVG